MSRTEKLVAAFLESRSGFRYQDFVRLLNHLGYVQLGSGKTGGSRRKFHDPRTGHLIMLHEPHDGLLGPGTTAALREQLRNRGVL